ncbi:MAG: hypothetical protein LCH79_14900 [Proteobacteria bacterium]|jgi:hypothetical protein|nr:hypothetical protein [Ramlibacter sp.]MCA0214452.1 hypothetical protein [Pseudomonadota bacterium]
MTLDQLLHVLRAASTISGEKSFVLVGSQAVLLALDRPEGRLTLSDEIDLYPATAPEKADLIDGTIGALSQFHDEFGYHADGVGPETAVMPADWMSRASLHYFGDITAICPELHDLSVSKCVAMREKDAEFVGELLRNGHVKIDVLIDRIRQLDPQSHPVDAIVAWAQRRAVESQELGTP